MTYQQVRDVVSRMRNSHQQLREALEQSRKESRDPRTRMMLEALRREEQELQIALARYGAQGQAGLLDTWLQYVPDEDLMAALGSMELAPNMPADEIVAQKLKFDQALTDLLRQLSEETSVPRVQEFFRHLLGNVESRTSQQAWSIREFQADAEPPGEDP